MTRFAAPSAGEHDEIPAGSAGGAEVGTSTGPQPAGRPFRDATAWLIGGLSLLVSVLFLVVNLAYNQWNFIPPVDDAYIHLQYARQIGTGHFLQYNTGDPISTGASSLLYVLILGGAYALGVTGSAFLPFAMLFGTLCLALTAALTYRLGTRLAGRGVGISAGLLVALSGPLAWGATSGMEIAFVAFLLVALLLVFTGERAENRFRWTPVVAVAAALTRTELLVFAAVLSVAMVWHIVAHARGTKAPWLRVLGRVLWIGLPAYAAVAQFAFYRIVTGSAEQNGVLAKSLLHMPAVYPLEVADKALTNLRIFLTAFTGLTTYDYVFPGALLLAILGVVGLFRRAPQWRGLSLAVGIGVVLVLASVSTLEFADVHHMRYVQPLLPVLLLFAVIGIHSAAQLFPTARRSVLIGGVVVALLFSASQLPAWSLRQSQQAAGIRDQQVTISNWIKGHLPQDAKVAVNDVGAPAYFSERYIVDLIGLATNGFATPNLHGPGSLYEELKYLPEDRRPDYFVIFNSWSVHGLGEGGLFGRELITFELKSPRFSYTTPSGGSACQAARFCSKVTVYEAEWDALGSGDLPLQQPAGQIRDRLNVADLRDEERHDYQVVPAHQGFQPRTHLRTITGPDGGDVVDSGRHVIGGESFTFENLVPNQELTIVGRVDATEPAAGEPTGSRAVQVRANGETVGTWEFEADPRGWAETTFTIPAELVTEPTLTIELGPLQEFLGPYPDYAAYTYWAVQ
ncbi:4-amino-4-deoxy-L-arabinose transferase [Saccharopolyspora antimicrobica]|uniref:4-amino-4-deoxy-L-arabinose transferase n=1 Tax=Saccharopolyspora antimicrobica TaxID=455193 RepID=A0A1I4Y906_9PSEU|nr:hypothetical protein [Saccharopolyspora antimicrobica]RKT82574.1 4-amino-4-deoxy-L-arabinose transferase-like glycosyltransferase [Saccharopolyspora antimicrobica]SFN34526.1 4-amino-4-deoxy-L-arabinose transferase [Saccharopolyspora antimicrobica]